MFVSGTVLWMCMGVCVWCVEAIIYSLSDASVVIYLWALFVRRSPLAKDYDSQIFAYLLVVIEDDDEVWFLSLLAAATAPEIYTKANRYRLVYAILWFSIVMWNKLMCKAKWNFSASGLIWISYMRYNDSNDRGKFSFPLFILFFISTIQNDLSYIYINIRWMFMIESYTWRILWSSYCATILCLFYHIISECILIWFDFV